jgi:Flp pilus assembly protein CpaB
MQFAQRLLSTRGGTIALSLMAAVLAAAILIAYLHRYRASVRDAGVPVTILTAKSLIEKGTSGEVIATQDLYTVSSTPKGEVSDGAITDPDTLKGRVATADIYPGEQLTAAKLSSGASASLANRITADQRAVTLPIEVAHGMIGQIEAGDHIDLYGGFNVRPITRSGTPTAGIGDRPVIKLIEENVLVLDAPEPGSRGLTGGGGKSKMTVRVSDEAAAKLAFTADNGVLWAMLRPRANATATSPDIVSVETVLFGVPPVTVLRSLGGRP